MRNFICENKAYENKYSLKNCGDFNGAAIYELSLKKSDITGEPFVISFREKMLDTYSTWTPTCERQRAVKQWFSPNESVSRFHYGAPVFSLISDENKNRITVAVSDCINPVKIVFGVEDIKQKEEVLFKISISPDYFNGDTYKTKIYVDESDVPFYNAIPKVALFWEKELSIPRRRIPDNAVAPLYSTWYNFHQQPTQDLLIKELEVASKLGFKTMILDDGWQFDGQGVGKYTITGDWEISKSKFPDFKGFVDRSHELGIKVMVWFSVPFLGIDTKAFQKYKDKILYFSERDGAGILDVRYKEVRDFIISFYVDYVNTYGIDGLKLDFIDSFGTDKAPLCNDKTDTSTVEEAVLKLLTEINEVLTAKKPDFMIEFREWYVGPKIVRFCNMLRVMDCAYDSLTNRVGIIDLRLLHKNVAVHSDMLYWSKTESPKNCAKQLINILFGVPQISVLLTESSKDQLGVVANYVKYWTENREILLNGEFKAYAPESNYSKVSSEDGKKKITALYSDKLYFFCGKNEDVFNNTDGNGIVVKSDVQIKAQIFDIFGNIILESVEKAGVCFLPVEIGGMCRLSVF